MFFVLSAFGGLCPLWFQKFLTLLFKMNTKNENSKSSFYYAFALLPKEKREAMKIFYAFSHLSDEIIDNENDAKDEKLKKFETWENEFQKSLDGNGSDKLLNSLTEIINKYKIPRVYFYDLLAGIKSDLDFENIKTIAELERYAYSVASTVGLIIIHILGFTDERAKNFAIALGKALQITNIMRDVKTDYANGRIYIPLEILEKHGYTERELSASVYNDAFYSVMRELYEIARSYYAEADKYFPQSDYGTLYPAQAMGKIYFSLLEKIKKGKFNVFENRFSVSKLEQIKIVVTEIIRGKLSG